MHKDTINRFGGIAYINFMFNPTWSFGSFAEFFSSKEGLEINNAKRERKRYGAFITFHLTHFQFIRLEYNYYRTADNAEPVNRILLQYDAVIGYHTHGRLR